MRSEADVGVFLDHTALLRAESHWVAPALAGLANQLAQGKLSLPASPGVSTPGSVLAQEALHPLSHLPSQGAIFKKLTPVINQLIINYITYYKLTLRLLEGLRITLSMLCITPTSGGFNLCHV